MSAGYRLALVVLLTGVAAAAEAQPLGRFQWQLEPYCNVLTLSITRSGEVYRLEGTDDQCGAARASVIGTAASAAGGDVGLGMSIVTTPGATTVHVRATLQLPSLSGSWQDSAGHAGAFVPVTAPASAGSPRPTSRIGAPVVNPTTVQRRITGTCPGGQFISGINDDGLVSCTTEGGGTITRVAAGDGLVVIGGAQVANLYFHSDSMQTSQGLVARAPASPAGTSPIQGQGQFFSWHAGKGALRAGQVLWYPSQWNDTATGEYSVGLGRDARAFGAHSTSIGDASIADGRYSVALGQGYATGMAAVAIGRGDAHGQAAFSAGLQADAIGLTSVALGTNVEAPADAQGSFVFGDYWTQAAYRMVGGANQFNVRAASFVEFLSNADATVGVRLDAGSWRSASDRRLKEHFRPLDGERVLGRLARLPIREWNYITQDAGIRHLGPTAQDFQAAFGLGESPQQISMVDADGIALAALRTIEARTRQITEALHERQREQAAVRARLLRLERLAAQGLQ